MAAPEAPAVAEYFAVPDPADPARMTYWRRSRGVLRPWPPRARYGPLLTRADVPAVEPARREFLLRWAAQVAAPWRTAILAAVETDPLACAARFASFQTRCCCCGRVLRDSASKTYGAGPECRSGWPASALAAMVEAVGRAHAAAADTDFDLERTS